MTVLTRFLLWSEVLSEPGFWFVEVEMRWLASSQRLSVAGLQRSDLQIAELKGSQILVRLQEFFGPELR
jgi:hypothetical protein